VEEPGVGALYQVVSWPSLSDFIADRDRVNLGTRVSSSPTPLFSIDPQGDLIAAEVAPWDPTKMEVHRYRDALDYCKDNNTILGVIADQGNLVGLTFDAGRQGLCDAGDSQTLEAAGITACGGGRMWGRS
jgi:hypothetical protein